MDELFLYSKLDLKQVSFQFEHADIVGFLDACIDELRYVTKEKGIDLEWDERPQSGIAVFADLEKLKRAVLNIIGNAQKFTDKADKTIRVSVRAAADRVAVEIRDNGIGIPREDIPHIFDRFYRAERSRNSSTGGSGLGLAISRQIVDGHGGRIWASSEPGIGTSLFFTLKRATIEEGAADDDDKHSDH